MNCTTPLSKMWARSISLTPLQPEHTFYSNVARGCCKRDSGTLEFVPLTLRTSTLPLSAPIVCVTAQYALFIVRVNPNLMLQFSVLFILFVCACSIAAKTCVGRWTTKSVLFTAYLWLYVCLCVFVCVLCYIWCCLWASVGACHDVLCVYYV